MTPCRIHLVAGTRPNVMKIAPLYRELRRQTWCEPKIVFLQQHASANMGVDLFAALGVDDPVTTLPLAQGDLGARFGSTITAYGALLQQNRPHLVVIPGDVDVSLAAAIAAKRETCAVAHLEAGLRSLDLRMPEELNRVMIDAIADILLAPSQAAAENLVYFEGKARSQVHFVGNIMIDSLVHVLNEVAAARAAAGLGLAPNDFAVVTFHRPANVDGAEPLQRIVDFLLRLSRRMHVVFPVHPRTRARLAPAQLAALSSSGAITLTEPLAYPDFINLVARARLVVTDSGGLQEETTYLGIPCLTLRETTERPVTVISGTNRLTSIDDIDYQLDAALAARHERPEIPLWDGHTALRTAHVLNTWWRGLGRPH